MNQKKGKGPKSENDQKMQHLRAIAACKSYQKEILQCTAVGTLLGALAYLWPSLMPRKPVPDEFQCFVHLANNEDMMDPLLDLASKLRLNNWSPRQQTNFRRMCDHLDVLALFDAMVDRKQFIPLDSNYCIQYILSQLDQCYMTVLEQKFQAPALGQAICELITQVETSAKAIKHNVELQIQTQQTR